jgi:adenylate cyclase 10
MPGRRGSGGSNTSMSQASDHEPIIILHPMVIVLEDLNLYDAISFHLIREVLRRFNRVLFIATVRDQYTEIQFMPKKTAQEEKDKKSVVTQDDVFSIGLQSIEDELEDT